MLVSSLRRDPDTADWANNRIRFPEDSHGPPRPSELGPECLTHHAGLGTAVFGLGSTRVMKFGLDVTFSHLLTLWRT
jgi:hypothetical protein